MKAACATPSATRASLTHDEERPRVYTHDGRCAKPTCQATGVPSPPHTSLKRAPKLLHAKQPSNVNSRPCECCKSRHPCLETDAATHKAPLEGVVANIARLPPIPEALTTDLHNSLDNVVDADDGLEGVVKETMTKIAKLQEEPVDVPITTQELDSKLECKLDEKPNEDHRLPTSETNKAEPDSLPPQIREVNLHRRHRNSNKGRNPARELIKGRNC